MSSSSYHDAESERFLSSGSATGRRVSFNEAALFEQSKKTQEKGRRLVPGPCVLGSSAGLLKGQSAREACRLQSPSFGSVILMAGALPISGSRVFTSTTNSEPLSGDPQ